MGPCDLFFFTQRIKVFVFVLFSSLLFVSSVYGQKKAWLRINQLGYSPKSVKVAVWAGKEDFHFERFEVIDSASSKVICSGQASAPYGAYGPFIQSYRLNFTALTRPGTYYIRVGEVVSPVFKIHDAVYQGAADFALRYMRQQRSGYNPFFRDSCHVHDGYTMYGPMADSTLIDVSGGWHDATDYLQYATTSANVTYHLLAAYRDFPEVFQDDYDKNGDRGGNGVADVLDEAKWGLEWLLKMHPREDWLFQQLADDRDHAGMRLPTLDSVDYGMGKGGPRPVYFATGEPQGLGKAKNRSTGVASIAGKFASAFALASQLYKEESTELHTLFADKSRSAYQLGLTKPGNSHTAPNREAYFYEEDNWVDDMELAAAVRFQLTGDQEYYQQALSYAAQEPVTPWMGADTARHYQWYPFHNFGHYELAKEVSGADREILVSYYKRGIEKVLEKGEKNAFLRGIPFVWCSNNLTAAFAIQCYLYRELSGDTQYEELEAASFDWIFGVNPWGKSMVYGLPSWGDTPKDPHSSLTRLYGYGVDGGMVDGPLATNTFNRMEGLVLSREDEYADFQSDLAVYHDDYADYSTNEPTMDAAGPLIYLLALKEAVALKRK